MTSPDSLLDFLDDFHSVALIAYVEVARETGQLPPDSELVRRRAYDLYEADLANRNAAKASQRDLVAR